MRSASDSAAPARLTRWEIVGAWLHVWTPPKGLDVPPVPWRKVALYGVAAAALLGVALALIIPPLDKGKRAGAALRAKEQAAALAAERTRLRADQRVHLGSFVNAGAAVAALEAGITADAKARASAGTITGQVLETACEPAGDAVIRFPRSRVYKCFVKTASGIPGQDNEVLGAGYPFIATVYFDERKLAWCKQNPRPDEKGRRLAGVRMSPECAGKLSEVL